MFEICGKKHIDIVFDNFKGCPICAKPSREDELNKEIKYLEDDISALEGEIEELREANDRIDEELTELRKQVK